MNQPIVWRDDVDYFVIEDPSVCFPDSMIYWEEKNQTFPLHFLHQTTFVTNEIFPLEATLSFVANGTHIPIYHRHVVRSAWFEQTYTPVNETFGAYYRNGQTYFSIWAPIAQKVVLCLEDKQIPLERQQKGVWKVCIDGNYHGSSYQFDIQINGKTNRVNDPYAKSLLANSEKSVVVDFSQTIQIDTKRPEIDCLQDSLIYELHIRDASMHPNSGVQAKGKFLGLTEKQTKTKNAASTSLSYIKDLGVTHVQLLPINDFARVDENNSTSSYNWGYDPLFFQGLEGSYSLDPTNPIARINECKQMIDAFHREQLSVILDVVFNHVFDVDQSPFEQIVPGYYFRYHPNGQLSNGTGVGNDFATERKMARKFILDTIDLFLTEYQISGFRFDLMGAIDLKTMQAIEKACRQESNPILLLGEGWDLATALAQDKKSISAHSSHIKGIRFFNDFFRDRVKGSNFSTEQGYVNGNGYYLEHMRHLVTGSVLSQYGYPFVSEVTQTVNYVECHDNHTLWDLLVVKNNHTPSHIRKKMHQLATALTILSQGIPFIHAGQEWFRTKFGDGNSYISSDSINQLDWNEREKQSTAIQFVKKLIAIRQKYAVFRLTIKQDILERIHFLTIDAPLFAYVLFDDVADISVYFNPTNHQADVQPPSSGHWNIEVTNSELRTEDTIRGNSFKLHPYECLVVCKSSFP